MRRFINAKELAALLGVPQSWIYERTRVGGPEKIPHLKLGKYLRFNPCSPEFQNWLLSHTVGHKEE